MVAGRSVWDVSLVVVILKIWRVIPNAWPVCALCREVRHLGLPTLTNEDVSLALNPRLQNPKLKKLQNCLDLTDVCEHCQVCRYRMSPVGFSKFRVFACVGVLVYRNLKGPDVKSQSILSCPLSLNLEPLLPKS